MLFGLSRASASGLFQTSGCSWITPWWGPMICGCFVPQKEDFCSQGSLRGDEHHAGCAPPAYQGVELFVSQTRTPREPRGVAQGVGAGAG